MTDTQQRLEEAFGGLGLTERQAAVAAAGHNPPAARGFDGVVAGFRRLGMTESAAKSAAVGRDSSESEARRGFDQAARPSGSDDWRARFDRLEQLVAEASDAELAELASRSRRPAKAASRTSSSRQPATVRRASSQASTRKKPASSQRVMISEAAAAEHEAYGELRRAGVTPERAARAAAERAHGPDRRVVALQKCLRGG